MTDRILGPLGIKAIENRHLNPETAVRLGLFTARSENGEVIPDAEGNVMVFPFDESGVTVNEKYRAPGKKFWQKVGGKRTFFNADALDDPGLYNGSLPLVILEGEIDCLTALDCGFPLSVSVPDGAPPAADPSKPLDPIDPATESSGKFEYLWNNRDRLKKIKRFIIAVDNDPPGKRMADELVRRLSASRCHFVTYPEGCKDLNDVLMRDGVDAARAVLEGAQPYPIRGVYTLSEYPDRPQIETFSTGWSTVDSLFKMFFPSFIVVSGIPNHGKSSWVMHLLVNMAEMYGYRSALFSPEMPVVPHLRDKIRRISSRVSVDRLTIAELANIDRWINDNFIFIDHDVVSDDDLDLTLEWIMERAVDAILRYGIRILILDPWNEVEHCKDSHESTTEYINRSLRKLKKFAHRYGLAIIIIAHPTKFILSKDGKTRPPTPYDIDGSAAWANKPDVIAIVHRPPDKPNQTQLFIDKVRFEGTGERGQINLRFDRDNSRYELLSDGGST